MLDIKLIRSNPDFVKAGIRKRNKDLDEVIDQILVVDAKRREAAAQVEALKAEQNQASREIPRLKKAGEDTTALMERMKAIVGEIKDGDNRLSELDTELKDLLLSLPNLPDEDVVAVGKENNVPIRY